MRHIVHILIALALFTTNSATSWARNHRKSKTPTETQPVGPEKVDPDTEKVRRHYEAGARYYDADDYVSAVREFLEAYYLIRNNPDRIGMVAKMETNIALCYDRLENYQEAIRYYQLSKNHGEKTVHIRDKDISIVERIGFLQGIVKDREEIKHLEEQMARARQEQVKRPTQGVAAKKPPEQPQTKLSTEKSPRSPQTSATQPSVALASISFARTYRYQLWIGGIGAGILLAGIGMVVDSSVRFDKLWAEHVKNPGRDDRPEAQTLTSINQAGWGLAIAGGAAIAGSVIWGVVQHRISMRPATNKPVVWIAPSANGVNAGVLLTF